MKADNKNKTSEGNALHETCSFFPSHTFRQTWTQLAGDPPVPDRG